MIPGAQNVAQTVLSAIRIYRQLTSSNVVSGSPTIRELSHWWPDVCGMDPITLGSAQSPE